MGRHGGGCNLQGLWCTLSGCARLCKCVCKVRGCARLHKLGCVERLTVATSFTPTTTHPHPCLPVVLAYDNLLNLCKFAHYILACYTCYSLLNFQCGSLQLTFALINVLLSKHMIESWEMELFCYISKHSPNSMKLEKFPTKPQLSSLRSPFGPGPRIWCSSSLDVHQHASLNMLHPYSGHSE